MSSIREILEGVYEQGVFEADEVAYAKMPEVHQGEKITISKAEAQLNTYVEERVREAHQEWKKQLFEHPQAVFTTSREPDLILPVRAFKLEEKKPGGKQMFDVKTGEWKEWKY